MVSILGRVEGGGSYIDGITWFVWEGGRMKMEENGGGISERRVRKR